MKNEGNAKKNQIIGLNIKHKSTLKENWIGKTDKKNEMEKVRENNNKLGTEKYVQQTKLR